MRLLLCLEPLLHKCSPIYNGHIDLTQLCQLVYKPKQQRWRPLMNTSRHGLDDHAARYSKQTQLIKKLTKSATEKNLQKDR